MASFQLNLLFACRTAVLASACLMQPVVADESTTGLSEREISKRHLATMEAHELLRKGDESYQAGRYAEAVEAYAGAHGMIPNAPLTAELLMAAKQRYVQASIEHAKNLSRTGDVPAAKAAIEKVLDPSVAPGDPSATLALAELNDPIRTNPALTAGHAADVDQVRRLLYTAEGAYNLGKFDQAKQEYEKVLGIDPTNTAARRGIERVTMAKTGYYQSANDEARAAMLAQVAAEWELQVSAPNVVPELADPAAVNDDFSFIPVANKLSRIIVPSVRLEQANIEESLEFLRVKSVEFDQLSLNAENKGINFNLNLGDATPETAAKIRSHRFDLKLDQLPLSEILRYITEFTGTSYITDDFSVIIRPLGSTADEMISRTYRVPADFLSSLNSSGGGGTELASDPFAEPQSGGGLLARRMGVQEAMVASGISFPAGSSANLNTASNILQVTNTPLNQDMIQQLVESIAQTEPVSVAVRVTMIRVLQTTLEELGYDWLLDDFKLSGNGGNGLFLAGGTQGNGGDLSDIPLAPGSVNRRPITAGNRSGDGAISGDSLESVLTDNIGGPQTNLRAPGVLAVNGYVNNSTVQMLMRGLDQKKGVDLMIHPSTVTRSGQASTIRMIREFMYPTEYEAPEVPQQVGNGGETVPITPANPTAFEMREVGLILDVLPVADANRQFIDLKLQPELVDLLGFVNYGSPINATAQSALGDSTTVELTRNAILMPVFSTQRLNTQVTIADGATLVLGGLMEQRLEKVEDKTPILGSIPIVGRMFQSDASQTVSTAIIFLVNVELLDPTGRSYRAR